MRTGARRIRTAGAVVAAVLGAVLVSGCGGGSDDAAEPAPSASASASKEPEASPSEEKEPEASPSAPEEEPGGGSLDGGWTTDPTKGPLHLLAIDDGKSVYTGGESVCIGTVDTGVTPATLTHTCKAGDSMSDPHRATLTQDGEKTLTVTWEETGEKDTFTKGDLTGDQRKALEGLGG